MPNYIVSYDLNGPSPTHAQMDTVMRGLGDLNGRILESVWYVRTGATIEDLAAYLRSKIGPEDRLLVVEGVTAQWQNLLIAGPSVKTAWES